MSGAIVGEAVAVFQLVQLAQKQKWFHKLKNTLQKKHRILVLGCTGVGKTNLIDSLSEVAPKAIDYMNRTEFPAKHRLKVLDKLFDFIDTPGQILHGDRRLKAIREAISLGLSGVINVVSYGYHEGRIGKKEALKRDGSPRQNFMEKMRKQELEALGEWNTILGGPEMCNWLITVVTKADLWWKEHEEVLHHYTNGPYYLHLGDAKNLSNTVVEYCSVLHKFYGETPLAGTFDEQDRVRTRGNLLRIILEAVSK